jgi:hypothetical protein
MHVIGMRTRPYIGFTHITADDRPIIDLAIVDYVLNVVKFPVTRIDKVNPDSVTGLKADHEI